MEFTFLGTSSGVPTRQRNVSGLALKYRDQKSWCLVDCGEGTQHQLLNTPLSLVQLEAIFITHVHGDHTFGLPGLVATAAMAGRKQDLIIVAPQGVQEYLQTTLKLTETHLPYALHFIAIESMVKITLKCGFKVTAHELSHRVPSYGFRFEEIVTERHLDTEKLTQAGIPQGKLWGDVLRNTTLLLDEGKTINCSDYILPMRKPRSIIVGGDNDTPEKLTEAVEGVEVLIHEATCTQEVYDKVGPGPQHSTAKQLATFATAVNLPNLVLTHFSARYHHPQKNQNTPISVLADEARLHYSGNLFMAEDFKCFHLTKDGELIVSDSPSR